MSSSRGQFEAWHLSKFCGGPERLKRCTNADEVYYFTATQEAWVAWQASREAVVVKLPERAPKDDPYVGESWDCGFNVALDECRAAFEAAGLKVKP